VLYLFIHFILNMWFVIECDQDRSVCRVPIRDIALMPGCAPSKGDRVNFYYEGKTLYSGVIKDSGEEGKFCKVVPHICTTSTKIYLLLVYLLLLEILIQISQQSFLSRPFTCIYSSYPKLTYIL